MTNSREYMRKWRESHRQQCRAYQARYVSANRELVRERVKRWKREHRERYRDLDNSAARRRYHADVVEARKRYARWQKSPQFKAYRNRWQKEAWGRMTDSMVRKLICNRSCLSASQVPQEMVEAVRELVKVRRVLREHSKA